jgi:hypothetical protein
MSSSGCQTHLLRDTGTGVGLNFRITRKLFGLVCPLLLCALAGVLTHGLPRSETGDVVVAPRGQLCLMEYVPSASSREMGRVRVVGRRLAVVLALR